MPPDCRQGSRLSRQAKIIISVLDIADRAIKCWFAESPPTKEAFGSQREIDGRAGKVRTTRIYQVVS